MYFVLIDSADLLRRHFYNPIALCDLSIVILTDQQLFRQGLVMALGRSGAFKILGDMPCCIMAIHWVKKLSPQVVLLDMSTTGGGGDMKTIISSIVVFSKVIILCSGMPDRELMQIGVSAFHSMDSPRNALENLIVRVAAGYLQSLEMVKRETRYSENLAYRCITARELVVARLVAKGETSKDIAIILGIAVKTVQVHRSHILKKLGLPNTAALVNSLSRHT